MLYNIFLCYTGIRNGLVAQLVEQLTLNQLVVGSSPTGPILLKIKNLVFEGTRTQQVVRLVCGSSVSEQRLECFCYVMKSRKQNTELPFIASEQDSPTGPILLKIKNLVFEGTRTQQVVRLVCGSSVSEQRLECFCYVMKSRKQNTELPFIASEQDSPTGPSFLKFKICNYVILNLIQNLSKE